MVYNAVSNELVRTKTLTKNTIVQIDAQPFKQWYLKKYGVDLGKKKGKAEADAEEVKLSGHVKAKQAARLSTQRIDPAVVEQFQAISHSRESSVNTYHLPYYVTQVGPVT